MERGSGGLPICQLEVPALSIWAKASPGSRWRAIASAVGERQILPRQTNSRRVVIFGGLYCSLIETYAELFVGAMICVHWYLQVLI